MEFYERFKRVRNRISKVDTLSLIHNTSAQLHKIERMDPPDWKGWLPWHLLLLLKWGIEYGGGQYPPEEAKESVLVKLMNLIKGLEDGNVFLKEGGNLGLQKFLRTTAFQQLWFQTRLGKWELSRQYILFCELPQNHPIQKKFIENYKLEPAIFLEISLFLWIWLGKSEKNYFFKLPNQAFIQPRLCELQIHGKSRNVVHGKLCLLMLYWFEVLYLRFL